MPEPRHKDEGMPAVDQDIPDTGRCDAHLGTDVPTQISQERMDEQMVPADAMSSTAEQGNPKPVRWCSPFQYRDYTKLFFYYMLEFVARTLSRLTALQARNMICMLYVSFSHVFRTASDDMLCS